LRFGFSPEVSRGRIFPSFAAAFAVAARSAPGRNLGEGRDLSPNEMFAACVGITGYVPLPLTGDDYIEFLPASFRTLNDYGLTIDNRTYDCKALNPYRRLDSGLPGGNRRKWEVHYQPYDITIVWLRDHCSDEWFTVPWVYRSVAGQPFGLALWEHARRMTTERSGPRPAEADIARNLADLLNRAHGRDLTPDEARVVAIDANRPVRQAKCRKSQPIRPNGARSLTNLQTLSEAQTRTHTTCSIQVACGGGSDACQLRVQRGYHAGRLGARSWSTTRSR
jgi:hypothetical protein